MKEIKLKSVRNIRDFADTSLEDGRKIKPDCFIRSASLAKLSGRDAKFLTEKCKLRTVIDLRTDAEISEKPDVEIDGVENIHIPIFSDAVAGISHEKGTDKNEILNHLPELGELYKYIVSDESCINQLKKVFEIIVNAEDKTILWHCTEGKDRCGIVSALFLSLLDVDRETIIDDYLMTNKVSAKRANKYYWIVRISTRDFNTARKVRRIFAAEREYIEAAFDEIEKNYKSVDNFIREKLEITDEIKKKMKEKYLVRSENKSI